MTTQLQRGQSYPELGIRVDNKGITYDLRTGQTLSRGDVDNLVRNTDFANLGKKRGGVNGFYDRNKGAIVPILDVAATTLTGGMVPPGVTSALIKGADQEGHKFGSRFDVGDAAKGYATGALANVGANALGEGLSTGMRVAEGNGLGTAINEGAKAAVAQLPGLGAVGTKGWSAAIPNAVNSFLGGGGGNGGGGGGGAGDIPPWMKALALAQVGNAAALQSQSSDYAKKAYNTTNDFWNQRSGLRSQGIAGMQDNMGATPMPQLSKIGAAGNPFAQG